MRKRIQILIGTFALLPLISRADLEKYESARGFKIGKCFLHFAQLNCAKANEPCEIDLFNGSSRTTFKTSFRDKKQVVGFSRTGDFIIRLENRNGNTETDLLKMDQSVFDSERKSDLMGFANEVPCPE